MTVINESGLYALILSSKLDSARLIAAMACVECGIRMHEVSMDEVWQGYDLAFPKAGRRRRERLRQIQEALKAQDEYYDWSPTAFDDDCP